MSAFLERYAQLFVDKKAEAELKFHLCYISAKTLSQDLPKDKPWFKDYEISFKRGIFAGGWVYKHLSKCMGSKRHSDKLLALDLNRSKFAMPKISSSFQDTVRQDYLKKMTNPPPEPCIRACAQGDTESTDFVERYQAKIRDKILEIVRKVYPLNCFKANITVPSLSACYELSSRQGGQIGALMSAWLQTLDASAIAKELDSARQPGEIITEEQIYVRTRPGFSINRRQVDPNLTPLKEPIIVRSFPHYDRIIADEKGQKSAIQSEYSILLSYYVSLFQDWVITECERHSGPIKVKPHGIPEPLKVRTITKGEAAMVYLCTQLQKTMHKYLRRTNVFQFTGHPDTVDYIAQTFPTSCEEGYEYVAGDMDGATDNIHPWASRWCWDCIAGRLGISGHLRELGGQLLTEHLFFDTEKHFAIPESEWTLKTGIKAGSTPISRLQQCGQLMGSPMSFPVLCIINAACWMVAHDVSVDTAFGPDSRLLINGDDIAYYGKSDLYHHWWNVNACVGLMPSLGKNVRSKDSIEINSHTYVVRRNTWRSEPYVNLAILQGIYRKGMDAGCKIVNPWFELEPNYRYLIRDFDIITANRLRSLFLEFHTPPEGIPEDIPVQFGGMGLLRPDGQVSLEAAQFVAYCLTTDLKQKFYGQRPKRPTCFHQVSRSDHVYLNPEGRRVCNSLKDVQTTYNDFIATTIKDLTCGSIEVASTYWNSNIEGLDDRESLRSVPNARSLLGVLIHYLVKTVPGTEVNRFRTLDGLNDFSPFNLILDTVYQGRIHSYTDRVRRVLSSEGFKRAKQWLTPASYGTCSQYNVQTVKVPIFTPHAVQEPRPYYGTANALLEKPILIDVDTSVQWLEITSSFGRVPETTSYSRFISVKGMNAYEMWLRERSEGNRGERMIHRRKVESGLLG
jgi:hypothetical protein